MTLEAAADLCVLSLHEVRRAFMAGKFELVGRADKDGPCLVSRASLIRAKRLG